MEIVPLGLPLVDRSRYETATGHCFRDWYLSYYAGPHGYGWAAKAQAVPLVTGTMLAEVQAKLHQMVMDWEQTAPPGRPLSEIYPTEAQFYDVCIVPALAAYKEVVDKRGLSNIVDAEDLRIRTLEQLTLLEGLAWMWYYVALPTILQEWRIVHVEGEEISVLGCTCGLGDHIGTAEQHDQRGCGGFGYMTRGDFICQHRIIPGRYSYHECKAPGETNKNTDAAWEYRVQLLGGTMGFEDRFGVEIQEIHLQQSIKGKRQPEYVPGEGPVGPKYQNSILVYGFCRDANPPFNQEEWALKTGKAPKGMRRRPIWELTDIQGALSPVHYWVNWLGKEQLASLWRPLGPIMRSDDRRGQFERQLIGEQRRWMSILWELYGLQEQGSGWGSPIFMAKLDALVPQNRGDACHSYYGEPCSKRGLCDKLVGWENPELIGYIPRRPHHEAELQQAIGRGLLAPEEGLADDGEE